VTKLVLEDDNDDNTVGLYETLRVNQFVRTSVVESLMLPRMRQRSTVRQVVVVSY
jgi:hypothetical protein